MLGSSRFERVIRVPGVGGENFREAKTQERIGRRSGATRVDVNGLDRRIKASNWVKLAERDGSVA